MTAFGDFVRTALVDRGMSLRKLAKAIQFDPGYLSRVLSGQQTPSPALATALDAYLGAEGALSDLATTLTPDDRARLGHAMKKPSAVDGVAVDRLADVLAAQRRLDDSLPASVLLPSVRAQWGALKSLAKEARGPHADRLREVAAEWVQFVGWLAAESGDLPRAVHYLTEAEARASDLEHGPLTAQALNFRGYSARHAGDARGIVRWFSSAAHIPDAHPLQRVGDLVQAAHGYALLGDIPEAKMLLGNATDLLERKGDSPPPQTAYWLSPTFCMMNVGLAHLGIGEHGKAAESLRAGLSSLPADQVDAEWTAEYRAALESAEAKA